MRMKATLLFINSSMRDFVIFQFVILVPRTPDGFCLDYEELLFRV